MFYNNYINQIISLALSEDIGTGDITTNSIVPKGLTINGIFICKENGVICGLEIVRRVFASLDNSILFEPQINDGEKAASGRVIAKISGPASNILTGERVALNFLQLLSGIATKTAILVEQLAGTQVRIVDTRKTAPGLRVLEKYAVKTGGGYNHRISLADGILIKDNHIKAAGGIKKALEAARKNAPATLKTEVEVENLMQVQEAVDARADIIMLDNMDINTMKHAVNIINRKALVEASGNMEQMDLLAVANTGVNMISIGTLTHSVKALDISLKFL